jgi:hypothetical protein
MLTDTIVSPESTFDTLNKVRKRHVELMRQTLDPEAASHSADEIVVFMRRVAKVGTFLSADDERTAAQNILDYWNATLLTSGAKKTDVPCELDAPAQGSVASRPIGENPFRDASALGVGDRTQFSGREEAVAALLDVVQKRPIVFVSGSAGSGRNSLVMAGVVAHLQSRSKDRLIVLQVSSLGSDPLRALSHALPKDLRPEADELRRSPERFRACFDAAASGAPALLVIDNVEELFTRCPNQAKREAFAEAVSSLAEGPGRRNTILIVLDEYAEQLIQLPAFKALASADARYTPPPPTSSQIQRVFLDLAGGAGLRVDHEYVQELARDLQGDPGAFALVRFVLLHLWPLSNGGFAGLDACRELGRPSDLLGRVAEETYERLPKASQDACKRLFLSLVRPDTHGAQSRRESRKVLDNEGSDIAMDEAIEAFGGTGILRQSAPGDNADDGLKIVHDLLMSQWPRLVAWLTAEKHDSERLFRLIETARLWDGSGRSSGYLLNGEGSIADARKALNDSRDAPILLKEYVGASEAAWRERERRETRRLQMGLGLVVVAASALFVLVVGIFYYMYNRQALINNAIHDLLRDSSDRNYTANQLASEEQNFFKKMQFYQRFGGAEINLIDTKLPNLTLPNRSFDNLRLIRSTITGLDMSHDKDDPTYLSPYVFNESLIKSSNFSGANLAFSQFRDTLLADANFSNTNLYRASFDGAQLCSVNFNGASLLQSSFWNSTFDAATLRSLKSGAWWLAKGWTPAQINDLAGRETSRTGEPDKTMSESQSARERTLTELLADPKKTRGITSDIIEARNGLVAANDRREDFARAQALNRWAWTLAINGLNVTPDDWRSGQSNAPSCVQAEPIPKTAFCAANQALSLINDLSGKASPSAEDYRTFRASIEDTLGYILLQKNDAEAALPLLTEGAGEKSRNERDALFRLSVAEYTLGDKEWINDMQRSIDLGYVPTHERALLFDEIELKFDRGKPSDFRTHLDVALQTTNRPRNAPLDGCGRP